MKTRGRKGRPSQALRESGAEGVDALRQAILGQARAQARQLLHEAQTEVQGIQQQAQREAEAIGKEILDRARHETALERQRQISAARLEVHRKQLGQREEQIAELFAAANERLERLHHSDDYREILQSLAVEAAGALDSTHLIVLVAKGDAQLLNDDFMDSIAHELKQEMTLERSPEPLDSGAGVVVETADGRLRYDNTFAGRMDRLRDLLRAGAYDILTGATEREHDA